MANNNNRIVGQSRDQNLNQNINNKISYLKQIQAALQNKNDLRIYQLINSSAYNQIVSGSQQVTDYSQSTFLINDLRSQISHYLSDRLIDYLGRAYPFFYYNEYVLGHFNIYFGNWWDHRLFGKLDVLNVKFNFNEQELANLHESFRLEASGHNVHSDKIIELSDQIQSLEELKSGQSERDEEKVTLHERLRQNGSKNAMPWESGKIKDEKSKIMNRINEIEAEDEKASGASQSIEKLKQNILSYTKFDTILGYEKQNIRQVFGSFDQFMEVQQNLYQDYIKNLIHNGEAGDNND